MGFTRNAQPTAQPGPRRRAATQSEACGPHAQLHGGCPCLLLKASNLAHHRTKHKQWATRHSQSICSTAQLSGAADTPGNPKRQVKEAGGRAESDLRPGGRGAATHHAAVTPCPGGQGGNGWWLPPAPWHPAILQHVLHTFGLDKWPGRAARGPARHAHRACGGERSKAVYRAACPRRRPALPATHDTAHPC